jgi:hypothetical protein
VAYWYFLALLSKTCHYSCRLRGVFSMIPRVSAGFSQGTDTSAGLDPGLRPVSMSGVRPWLVCARCDCLNSLTHCGDADR